MDTGELQIERRILGEITILDCTGRIVVRRETEFLFDAAAFAIEHSRSVVLNLAGVSSIDSGGLGILVLLNRMAGTFCSDLRLCGANPHVAEMIKLTGLDKVLNLHRAEEDAVESCLRAMLKTPSSKPRSFRPELGCSVA